MRSFLLTVAILAAVLAVRGSGDAGVTVRVDAARVLNRVTPWMYGSCIEDVNHEIYCGLYAQRIFGESFEEPPVALPLAGWHKYGGEWSLERGVLQVQPDSGAKLVRDEPVVGDGIVACDVLLGDDRGENAGLILRVVEPHVGADAWRGYEISISARAQRLILGRHRNDWHLLKDVSAPVAPGRWHRLRVTMSGPHLAVYLDGDIAPRIDFTDADAPLLSGRVGLRTWNSHAAFRNLTITTAGGTLRDPLNHPAPPDASPQVSAAWDPVRTGTALAAYALDDSDAYNSRLSQKIEYRGGQGTVGVANRGLNRWGIAVRRGRTYAGRVYLRQQGYAGRVTVALQSADGTRTYASSTLQPSGGEWSRRDFTLRPNATDPRARFALWIDRPGTVWVDQASLHGTGSELFHGGPFRADIGEKLVEEGLTFLRYGGSMVNAPEYRWKKMIGDPDRRPQYRGTWYPYSTNGFGIEEFLRFCEAARIEPAFAINIEETPQDAADLIEYLNGPSSTPWGRRRAGNGHPKPYGVRFIEIGNEETTNAHYLERFRLLEAAMHAKDPSLQLVIAAWWEPDNPVSREIVRALNGKAALWDVHVGGDGLNDGADVDRLFTRMERLVREWAPGTSLKACVFEENGGRHDLQRALGHARILNATRRHGDFVLIDCPANCLQPWQQNDNGWDQGQLFFTPDHAWAMPPYYAQQMASRNHLPLRVESSVEGAPDLDVTALRSNDARSLVLSVVNVSASPRDATISLEGFAGARKAEAWTLAGALDAVNPPTGPGTLRPERRRVEVSGPFRATFPAHSYMVLRLAR